MLSAIANINVFMYMSVLTFVQFCCDAEEQSKLCVGLLVWRRGDGPHTPPSTGTACSCATCIVLNVEIVEQYFDVQSFALWQHIMCTTPGFTEI